MPQSTETPRGFRFGVFEIDLRTGELRKDGRKVKLQEQPFQVLAMLLERAGEVVTREEMQKKLWPEDTFVDFEHGLNIAINKIREALGDSADNPRFVETLPKRGYRFIAPTVRVASLPPAAVPSPNGDVSRRSDLPLRAEPSGLTKRPVPFEVVVRTETAPPAPHRRTVLAWGLGSLALVALAVAAFLYLRPAPPRSVVRLNMAVTPAEQLRGLNCPIVALSPDGTHVAFVGTRSGVQQIYVRALDTLEARAIPGTEGAYCTPFFSPD